MSVYSTTPRFLAGAVCPRCEALDRIKVFSKDGKDFRECVSCGFLDELHFPANSRELPTRVNQTQAQSGEDVVKILPLDSQDK
ncbi:YheV family putative zinc ribbon protein [Gilvimarinus sp. DA14]|uniref:YheV family putative zinc ribbon protein n=1 Tax=Gilvimarinus sp. DA14 TaxID=2956798 RepID=UPI0020B8182B|nr:YheV family putative zinc ribbon protein [Gilvimarinus sp. DA14]UTF59117.1 YheV family putative metal-binding protein [Gilvimarinus sp. DA14]